MSQTKKKKQKEKKCKKCGETLSVMSFMGLEPDGMVCNNCGTMYDLSGKVKIGKVY